MPAPTAERGGVPADELLDIYRLIYLSRSLDDREINMKKKNQIFFQISGAGHEVPLAIAGKNPDQDAARIRELGKKGTKSMVAVPISFVS